MKLISMFSLGVATVGMTCLLGYASAANSAPGDLIADGTMAPGGRQGGTEGETGRADKGTPRGGTPHGHNKQGAPGDTKPGTADAESSMRMQSEKNSPSGGSVDPKAPNAMGQSGREHGDTKFGGTGREDSSTGRSNRPSPPSGSGSMGGGSGASGSAPGGGAR